MQHKIWLCRTNWNAMQQQFVRNLYTQNTDITYHFPACALVILCAQYKVSQYYTFTTKTLAQQIVKSPKLKRDSPRENSRLYVFYSGYPLTFIHKSRNYTTRSSSHTHLSFFLSFLSFFLSIWQASMIFQPRLLFSFQKFDTFYWAHIVNLVGSLPLSPSAFATNEAAHGRPPRRIVYPSPDGLSLSSILMLVICFQFQSHLHRNACWKDIRNWYFENMLKR